MGIKKNNKTLLITGAVVVSNGSFKDVFGTAASMLVTEPDFMVDRKMIVKNVAPGSLKAPSTYRSDYQVYMGACVQLNKPTRKTRALINNHCY